MDSTARARARPGSERTEASPQGAGTRPTGGAELAADVIAIVPAAAVAVFWALSTLFDGAYFPSAWYPAAIVTVILCPLLLAAGWRLPIGGGRLSFGLLAAFVAWTALSILWADAAGHALEATNKLVFVLATAFVFAVTPWTERRGLWLLGGFVCAVTTASVVTLLSAAFAGDPTASFIESRFADPMGYAGASAAFAAIVVGPALALSARLSSPLWARAGMFAIAVVQIELALLPQSRGVLIGLTFALLFLVGFSPTRGWTTLRVLAAAAVAALTVGPILDVFRAANDGQPIVPALDSAVGGLAIAAAIALAVGFAFAYLEARRPRLLPGLDLRRAALPLTGALVIALALALVVFGGRISDQVSQHWDSFKAGDDAADTSSHLSSTGDPQRYDYWRVAVDATGESPLTGIGAGNFQDEYTVKREVEKHSRYAHSFWLRVLSETGIVGLLLIAGALIAGFVAVARAGRSAPTGARLLAAGALAATAGIFAHASVDWIDEFPAVLAPALAFLYLACRLVSPPPTSPPRRQGAGLLAGATIAGIALVGLVPAYLALRFTERAESAWPSDPATAYKDLDRAAWLSPLSSQPYLTRGEIALGLEQEAEAEAAFQHAIEIEDNWYPHLELALIASKGGRQAASLHQIAIARRLDAADLFVQETARRLRHGARLDPLRIGSEVRRETNERFYRLR
jgi:hypothetical protein